LGDEIELNATYARMGDFLKNQCKGYTGYVFTGNLDLAKKIRLKPSRRIEFLMPLSIAGCLSMNYMQAPNVKTKHRG
jgi:23S rRNA G2445 N2-methylase RlmL